MTRKETIDELMEWAETLTGVKRRIVLIGIAAAEIFNTSLESPTRDDNTAAQSTNSTTDPERQRVGTTGH